MTANAMTSWRRVIEKGQVSDCRANRRGFERT